MTDRVLYNADGVSVFEIIENSETRRGYVRVFDNAFAHYRITIAPHQGKYSVGIDAAWHDECPGQMANYSEYAPYTCALDEIHIDDDGLLVVMAKHATASTVDLRSGFTAKLPRTFVEPIRMALKRVAELAPVKSA